MGMEPQFFAEPPPQKKKKKIHLEVLKIKANVFLKFEALKLEPSSFLDHLEFKAF